MQRASRGDARERNHQGLEHEAIPDVTMGVMSELVRQDDLYLVVCVVRQKGVGDQDSPAAAGADERGVRAPGLVAEAPLVHAKDGHACAP